MKGEGWDDDRWYLSLAHLQLLILLQDTLHPPLHRVQVLRRRNIVLARGLSARQRQILGHDSIDVHGIDARLLQALGEGDDLWGTVQLSPLDQSPRPGEDRGDGVGGRLIAFLVLAVVPGDGAVRGLGLEGLAVGGDEDRGHQAQGAKSLGHNVRLHIAIVICRMSARCMQNRRPGETGPMGELGLSYSSEPSHNLPSSLSSAQPYRL